MSRPRLVLTLIVTLFSVTLGFAAVSSIQESAQLNNLFPHKSKSIIPNTSFVDTAQDQPTPIPQIEGCVTCHGQIEPMHKYVTTKTLERLKDGKDTVVRPCTACHGGNPVPRK